MSTALTSTERKFDRLTKMLQKLSIKGENGIPIFVEGKKDLAALRKLGIKGTIICVKNSGKILIDFLDEVKSKEIMLFMDFDENGVALAKYITQHLESKGVKVDSTLWMEIKSLIRKDVKDIEGIPSYLERLKKLVSHS